MTAVHCWVTTLKYSSAEAVSTPGVAASTGSEPGNNSSLTVMGLADACVRLTEYTMGWPSTASWPNTTRKGKVAAGGAGGGSVGGAGSWASVAARGR